ncbi:dynamin family protein [Pontibacillus yanchengensis]|uniref:Dynamin N-terminal domain-containing protein n=1 Tax=Pontibacillus yanchengensis Y32 TaxID=1385514 RepID=A0A0A2TFN7_9BACI|nr:dynamin family protein [Pontibacillus yanchengensis]KGP74677.1 hypothetical protein N782_00400 [Pontibacillus yanchengensis Y32]
MSFKLEAYTNARHNVLTQLNQISKLYNERREHHKTEEINELYNDIEQNNFQITVVGEFSRGKSTFINALLGKKILPSLARPTTTILNVISYAEEPSINLHFQDDKKTSEKIQEKDFKSLVAPKEAIQGDPASEKEYEQTINYLKQIKYARIHHPLPFLKDQVDIIDTPGTNDMDPNREHITNSIIPTSDAAILLLSANKILSDSERSFLRDRLLRNDIQKIFVVINFKDDLKTEGDRQKVIQHAETELANILHTEPKIFMVSSLQALNARRKVNGEEMKTKRGRIIEPWSIEETGFLELEKELAEFLQYDRGNVKLQRPVQRSIRVIQDTLEKQIPQEKSSLTQEINGLHGKVSEFRQKLDHIKTIGDEALQKIDRKLEQKYHELTKWYEWELDQVQETGTSTFEDNKYAHIEEISRAVENSTAPLERELHTRKIKKIQDTIEEVVESNTKHLQHEWLTIDSNMNFLYNNQAESGTNNLPIDLEEKNQESFFQDIYSDLSQSWSSSSSIFNKAFVAAGFVLTGLVEGVASIVNAGLNWLFGDRESKVDKIERQLQNQFYDSKRKKKEVFKQEWKGITETVKKRYMKIIQNKINETEHQLNTLLENTQLEEAEVQERLEGLKQQEQRFHYIKQSLEETIITLEQNEKAGVVQ